MARMMKLHKLQWNLEDLEGFKKPKIILEQYETTPHLAAQMLHHIESRFGAIDGKLVADLGCGTGRLMIGAAMLGAQFVVGIDVDPDALIVCQRNIEDFELQSSTDLVLLDLLKEHQKLTEAEGNKEGGGREEGGCVSVLCPPLLGQFDCVIMNPPFGTKDNEGIDMKFVRYGLCLTSDSVYSLHKTVTREHVIRVGTSWGVAVEPIAEIKFDLPATYSKHRHESQDIAVDLVKFTRIDRTRLGDWTPLTCVDLKTLSVKDSMPRRATDKTGDGAIRHCKAADKNKQRTRTDKSTGSDRTEKSTCRKK